MVQDVLNDKDITLVLSKEQVLDILACVEAKHCQATSLGYHESAERLEQLRFIIEGQYLKGKVK